MDSLVEDDTLIVSAQTVDSSVNGLFQEHKTFKQINNTVLVPTSTYLYNYKALKAQNERGV